MRAIRIDEWGGPEVLKPVEIDVPSPGDGEALVRVTRAGVNYADTHASENSYLRGYELPLIPGAEVAGVVDGSDRRVAAMMPNGGYAEYAAVHEAALVGIPDGISDEAALALLVQGLTAWHLYRTSGHLAQGESVVVVAAAGGVGSLAVQLAKPMGAGRVIALASSEEKRELALELGADVAVDSTAEDLKARIEAANDGRKVDLVLEMAGGSVFDACLHALAPFGRIVTYGQASRQGNEVSTGSLMARSRAVVGFWLVHCYQNPRALIAEPLADLFGRVGRGELRVVSGEVYPMSEARRAHEDMRARRTVGKVTLDPSR